jgi:hypothetical protein
VRYISNLPFASDKKLCFTLWQLKWCRKSNDKTVYYYQGGNFKSSVDFQEVNFITQYIAALIKDASM